MKHQTAGGWDFHARLPKVWGSNTGVEKEICLCIFTVVISREQERPYLGNEVWWFIIFFWWENTGSTGMNSLTTWTLVCWLSGLSLNLWQLRQIEMWFQCLPHIFGFTRFLEAKIPRRHLRLIIQCGNTQLNWRNLLPKIAAGDLVAIDLNS